MLLANHPLLGKIIPGDTASRLSIRAAEDTARFSLRIAPAAVEAAGAAFGSPLPTRIGGLVESGGRAALQLGPDEWMLTAPVAESDGIAESFAALQEPHSLVDTGHREVAILVEGEAAALALRSAIAFDIEAMAVGSGCRTLFDKAQIVLVREDKNRFRIEVWRSFADHVWGLLHAVSREIALGI
ncbi:sarcosine oxidase, subunit gamma (plasmid) [Azospirillum sp. B510]|uniref:sarcosine oxidase subunit gamma family protein n=1 Tax=Azospirillum sp. (strain B510) TaxID=137722 RepID=UPI0001C4C569|nr:sarcosine oxidase subunit gamma family protein [Azospirillum sp. B510]BAI75461.1 sarcosine oxidase, subunit gamma [Azospirillum sp. B510]